MLMLCPSFSMNLQLTSVALAVLKVKFMSYLYAIAV
jgi:hypothetical protein